MPSARPHPRITPIDSLRGLAALWVAYYHFSYIAGRQVAGGYLCVDLFFILSGVVLTHVYEHRIVEREITFQEFFVNRMARLYPLHLLTFLLTVAITAALLILQHQRPPDLGGMAYTGVLNLLLLQNVGLTSSLSWNIPAWSISTEIVLNMLWFHLLLGLRRTGALFAGVAAAAAALLLVGHGGRYDITVGNIFHVFNGGLLRCALGFFLGCLLYRGLIGPDTLQHVPKRAMNLASLAVLAGLGAAYGLHARSSPLFLDTTIVVLLFPALVLCSLHHGTALSHLLRLPPLRYLGDISYSVYMLQWPLGMVLSHLAIHLARVPVAAWVAIYFALLLAGSALCFLYVEVPLRNHYRSRP